MTRNDSIQPLNQPSGHPPHPRVALVPGVRYHLARIESKILIRSENGEHVIRCESEEEAKEALR